MKKKPLDEAPLEIYLKILNSEGYGEEAEIIKEFYIQLLTTIDGAKYTEKQVMETPYKNLVTAAELILEQAGREVQTIIPSVSYGGKIQAGKGAEKLNPDSLQRLMARQLQLHEEEKLRLGFG